jgi:multidrug efflux pump subunit AcrB
MPYMEHSDALLTIDWNAGITTAENDLRVQQLLSHVSPQPETTTAMSGVQEFVLSHTKELTGSEAVVYLKASSSEALDSIQESAQRYVAEHYPKAKIDFGISGNVYDVIFQTDKPDLEIRLQRKEGGRPSVAEARSYVRRLQERFPEVVVKPVVTEENLCYSVNPEQLAYYHVTYEQLYNRFKELAGSNQVHEIANGAQSVPVIIGQDSRDADLLLTHTLTNSDGVEVPLSYLVESFKA